MTGKTKALTVIVSAVVVCMLIYSPLTQAAQSNISLGDELSVAEIENLRFDGFHVRPRVRFAVWFLRNAEAIEVDGTVVALSEKKLILNTVDDQIRVNLPAEWTVESQVASLDELVENYLSIGENINVKALGADLVDKDGLRICLLVGYEIITESGVQAFANLKVNIQD